MNLLAIFRMINRVWNQVEFKEMKIRNIANRFLTARPLLPSTAND